MCGWVSRSVDVARSGLGFPCLWVGGGASTRYRSQRCLFLLNQDSKVGVCSVECISNVARRLMRSLFLKYVVVAHWIFSFVTISHSHIFLGKRVTSCFDEEASMRYLV